MANNRMFITDGKNKIFIAKYYPGTGWYFANDDFEIKLNEAFNSDDFGMPWNEGMLSKHGMWGNRNWKIVYEVEKDK